MANRVCFSASVIDEIVLTKSQAEIIREIRLATITLEGDLSPELVFYWKDRREAYRFALIISEWGNFALINERQVLALKTENSILRQKLYHQLTTKAKVRGGIPL